LTVRGDFDGGAWSSDFGPLILRGVDRQIGLTERQAAAFDDQRHPSYITYPARNVIALKWGSRRPYGTFGLSVFVSL